MIKIHSNIIIGSPHDLAQIINSVNYIINCSASLNNLLVHPNYINLNIQQFTFNSLQILNSLFDFISWKISLNQNIYLLCETGTNYSLIVGMFVVMKLYNLSYSEVYYRLSSLHNIGSYDFYSGLKYYEPYIIIRDTNNKMDIE